MQMKERILFCTHSIDNGGSAKSLHILLRNLPEKYAPAVLSLRDSDERNFYMQYCRKRKIPVFVFPFGWLPISYVNCPINIAAQQKRMEEMRAYIPQLRWIGAAASHICFNGYPATSIAPFFDAKIPQTLIAREQLICSQPEYGQIARFLRAHIRKAIAIGPMEARQLANIGIAHELVFNSAENTPEYSPPPPCPPVNFAVFTRFGPDKGLDTLFEAIKQTKKQLLESRAVVRIYGARGTQNFGIEEQLDAFMVQHDLSDLIKIEPWTNDVANAIKNANCVIRPDKSGSPWGRDIIEAMSLGRPVLATGALDVFVRQGRTGWLIPVDNPEALATQMVFLARNTQLLEKAGLEAFEFARENFNPCGNTIRIAEFLFGSVQLAR